jgi:urea transport system permease protein
MSRRRRLGVVLLGLGAGAGLGYMLTAWVVGQIRQRHSRHSRRRGAGAVPGLSGGAYKLAVFTLTAVIAAIAGALYYPQAGIINPAEIAPIASIYLAVWVAIGGRGRIYGAVIGAAFVSLLSSWFTGGQAPRHAAWVLHHPMGGLVAGAAGLQLRAGDAVCPTRDRRGCSTA